MTMQPRSPGRLDPMDSTASRPASGHPSARPSSDPLAAYPVLLASLIKAERDGSAAAEKRRLLGGNARR